MFYSILCCRWTRHSNPIETFRLNTHFSLAMHGLYMIKQLLYRVKEEIQIPRLDSSIPSSFHYYVPHWARKWYPG